MTTDALSVACRTILPSRTFNRLRFMVQNMVVVCAVLFGAVHTVAETPAKGAKAPDFTLSTFTGGSVNLAKETAKATTVVVVLRGYPGYDCPFCVKQVHDYVEHGADFAAQKVSVLFVYPGPPAELDQHAKDFLAKQAALPANFTMALDPDYKMTNLYGLRWDAPRETAYPSTFIVNRGGEITFEKVSHGHGDRTTAQDVLSQIGAK